MEDVEQLWLTQRWEEMVKVRSAQVPQQGEGQWRLGEVGELAR